MLKYFKRRKPTHRATDHAADLGDIMTAYAWGLNLHQWHALSDFQRAECRRTVTAAPRFQA